MSAGMLALAAAGSLTVATPVLASATSAAVSPGVKAVQSQPYLMYRDQGNNQCLDSDKAGGQVRNRQCQSDNPYMHWRQVDTDDNGYFVLQNLGQNTCLDSDKSGGRSYNRNCNLNNPYMRWRMDSSNGVSLLVNKGQGTCLVADGNSYVYNKSCDQKNPYMSWVN
ncbi:ricin-type beta-trefoil lectin domain protein [Streptomyces sp. NPDC059070]|uniref:RICIN domain-containing protein n=1 Tax=Streptomyces sp. NPDC059070 TaxID=3346713 RepID=UPI00368DD1FF